MRVCVRVWSCNDARNAIKATKLLERERKRETEEEVEGIQRCASRRLVRDHVANLTNMRPGLFLAKLQQPRAANWPRQRAVVVVVVCLSCSRAWKVR